MTTSTGHKQLKRVIIFMLLLFAAVGASPVFSQQIIATFGLGGEFLGSEVPRKSILNYEDTRAVETGMVETTNVLFVGRSGFAISLGIDLLFNADGTGGGSGGMNVDPVFGLGYIYYNVLYFGGILNIVPKPYIAYDFRNRGDGWYIARSRIDAFLAPTLVAGIDFGSFLLEARASYMIGAVSGISGFRFSIGAGVNVDSMW